MIILSKFCHIIEFAIDYIRKKRPHIVCEPGLGGEEYFSHPTINCIQDDVNGFLYCHRCSLLLSMLVILVILWGTIQLCTFSLYQRVLSEASLNSDRAYDGDINFVA